GGRAPGVHGHVALDRPRARRERDPAHQPCPPGARQRAHPGVASPAARPGGGGAGRMRIHMIAACGVGMSALAGLLRAAGHDVSGSDEQVYPPASTLLAELGIPVLAGWDAARLDAVDLVVCGNA